MQTCHMHGGLPPGIMPIPWGQLWLSAANDENRCITGLPLWGWNLGGVLPTNPPARTPARGERLFWLTGKRGVTHPPGEKVGGTIL